jgi:hypothetical protein
VRLSVEGDVSLRSKELAESIWRRFRRASGRRCGDRTNRKLSYNQFRQSLLPWHTPVQDAPALPRPLVSLLERLDHSLHNKGPLLGAGSVIGSSAPLQHGIPSQEAAMAAAGNLEDTDDFMSSRILFWPPQGPRRTSPLLDAHLRSRTLGIRTNIELVQTSAF